MFGPVDFSLVLRVLARVQEFQLIDPLSITPLFFLSIQLFSASMIF
jgi:hypothetical protein